MTTLPEGWGLLPLSELVENPRNDIVDGPFGSNLKRSDFHASGVPVLKIQNIKPNEIQIKNMDYVTALKASSLGRHSFVSGDIVMTKLGSPLGVSAIVGPETPQGVIVADLVRIRPGAVNSKFLCYQLNSPSISRFINDSQKGTTRPRINIHTVRNLPIAVPSLEEQSRIVELLDGYLSRLDKALADLDHADSQTLVFRRSILNALLNPGGSGSKQGFEGTDLLKDWQIAPLGTLVDVLDSKRIPLSAAERKHRDGPVPYYGATGQVGTIDKPLFDEPLLLLGEDGVQFLDPYKPKAYKISGPSWVNNHAHVLRPKVSEIEFGYLLHYLNAFDYQGYANGTTRLKLTQGSMNSIPVNLPPIEEQRRIVEVLDDHLSRLDSTRESIANQKSSLQTLRRSLLNKAFNGELGTN